MLFPMPADVAPLLLLVAASAIRPALLAPSTGAAAVLHGLHLKDGLASTYAYCDAIARFGEQPVPLDVNSLKKAKLHNS